MPNIPPRHARLLAILLALLGGHAAAYAVDREEIKDVRVYYAIVPDWDVSGGGSIDGGDRIGVQVMGALDRAGGMTDGRGWIWGGEGQVQIISDISGLVVGFTALAGYAYQMPDMRSLHFEATPLLGIGFADLRDSSDKSEIYYEWGIRGAVFWTFDAGPQIGLDLRIRHADADVIDSSGVELGIVGGYRF